MNDLELLMKVDRLLDDCPFGARLGHVITSHSTDESELAAWIVRVHEVRAQFAEYMRRKAPTASGL